MEQFLFYFEINRYFYQGVAVVIEKEGIKYYTI